MPSIWAFALLLFTTLTSAANLSISIPPSPPQLPNPATLPPTTHAVLLGPPGIHYSASLRRDNTFAFQDLPSASYLLTIHTRDYFFPPLRIDVANAADEAQPQTISAWQTFRGNEWTNKGPHYGTGKGELQISVQPASTKNFYQERGGFSILSFLKSPMILMALVSGVMIFGMPYLMDNSTLLRGTGTGDGRRTDVTQWTRRRRPSSRRCRRRVRSAARRARRRRCRISTWRAGWLGRVRGLKVHRRVVRSGGRQSVTRSVPNDDHVKHLRYPFYNSNSLHRSFRRGISIDTTM